MNFGGGFTIRVKKFGYQNIYYRDILFRRGKKKRRELGWNTDEKTKGAMFGEFSRAVRTSELKLHSDMLVKECGQYVMLGGKIEHAQSRATRDDSSKGRSHGDRVIAACVCLQGVRDRPLMRKNMDDLEYGKNPPQGTLAYRMLERERAESSGDDVWDDRGSDDTKQKNRLGFYGSV
jgi:hypothetical protein